MKPIDWLQRNTPENVSLSQLVVSSEAFYDPLLNLFNRNRSMKGKDYRPVEQKHTYNNKALVTAISRQFGNQEWLDKQNWVSGSVNAEDIIGFVGPVGASIDPVSVHAVAATFYLKVYKDWQKAVKEYYKAVKPAIDALALGLTDEAYKKATEVIKAKGEAPSFYKNPPQSFPVMARRLPKDDHHQLRGIINFQQPTKVKALDKKKTLALVEPIIKTLLDAESIREQIIKDSEAVVNHIFIPAFYQLAHSGSAKTPKDSKYSTEQWVALAKALDPKAVYWSSSPFTTTRTCYSEMVLAMTKWIDRSIR